MTWYFVILAIAVITFIFLAVLGPLGELPPAEPDRRPEEIDGEPVFDVVVRGYRMDEVDARIASMQAQIDELSAGTERTPDPVPVADVADPEQARPEQ